MTDVWVSTKKHYCDVCKCWVIGNSTNIKNHESSARHIGSLRRKIVESYRKDSEKKQQELMEKEELERLNQITMENGKVVNPLVSSRKVTNEILELTANKLYPVVDRETEMRRVMTSISKSLLGQQDTSGLEFGKTKWLAFVDSSDGTLCYYNNHTGHKTKVRPADFDGVLPSASAALTANWSLKFEPNKRKYYYHNSDTGEIRWLEDNIVDVQPEAQSQPQSEEAPNLNPDESQQELPNQTKSQSQELDQSHESDTGNEAEAQDQSEPRSAESTVKIKHENGGEEELIPHENTTVVPAGGVQYEAPMIGAWQVVEEKDGVFGNCIQSMEPYLNTPPKLQTDVEVNVLDSIRDDTFQSDLLNEDDLRPVGKVVNTLDTSSTVSFAKRKIPKRK